jgi:hypothetical protein
MMFHPQMGVLNYLLSLVGLPPSLWVYAPETVIPVLVLVLLEFGLWLTGYGYPTRFFVRHAAGSGGVHGDSGQEGRGNLEGSLGIPPEETPASKEVRRTIQGSALSRQVA